MEGYSALKRKEILTCATIWINLEDTLLMALTPGTNGPILYDSVHLWYLERTEIDRQKVEECSPRAGRREDGESVFNDHLGLG